jgi:hypothetical protein
VVHWPLRVPITALGRPSLVGGGVLPEHARLPKIWLASISVAVAFSGAVVMVVVFVHRHRARDLVAAQFQGAGVAGQGDRAAQGVGPAGRAAVVASLADEDDPRCR